MIIFENCDILTMTGEPRFRGSISIDGEKISDISKDFIPGSHQRIDLKGALVMPGFVDAHTHQGMFQGDIGEMGMDGNEMTDPATPHLRAIDSINPEDPSLKDAPLGGVTVINTGPGSANVMGGLFCVIKTAGNVVDKMIIKNPSALKVAFGENPKRVYGSKEKAPQTRMAIAAILREWLFKAKDYSRKMDAEEKPDKEKADFDIKLDILVKVLKREIPIHAHCHRADDIATAIRIAEEFKIRLVLIHATEGHKIAEYIAEKKIPCIIGPSIVGREKPELNEISFKTAGILAKAGVNVSLQSDTFPPMRYFQIIPCLAIKEGMSEDDALRAVTVNPAKLLGLYDRIGSLEKGKDADIVVWSGNPADLNSKVLLTYINGEEVYRSELF